MGAALIIARDLVREALLRRWFLGLGVAITLLLGIISFGLSIEVVDGALAATRLFGDVIHSDIRAADVALRPVFRAASYVVFYGGTVFGLIACADFGPNLLSPGRIEHLLSMPLPRAALIAGTFGGVIAVMSLAALYGAAGFTVILGLKTGVWSGWLLVSAALGCVSFAALYGAMLASAVFVRSAAVSALVGIALFVLGVVGSYRDDIAPAFEPGLDRQIFELVSLGFPPVSAVADAAARLCAHEPVGGSELGARLLGLLVFGCAATALGVWRFEEKDF